MASQKHKSNKTAHVLNLLASNAPEEEETSPVASEPDSRPAKAEATKNTEENPPVSTDTDTQPAIPIVSPLGETGDPLDAVIQGNLELELAADLKEKNQEAQPASAEKPKFIPGFPAGFVPPEPAAANPPTHDASKTGTSASQQTQATTPTAPDLRQAQTTAPVASGSQQAQAAASAAPTFQQAQTAAPATSAPQQEAEVQVTAPAMAATQQQGTPPTSPVTQETQPAPSPMTEARQEPPVPEPKKPELPSYQYINVMEQLVDGRVIEAMKMFDMCTCERCQIDVKALALTYLMPKYIVVDRGYSSPLLNFYSNKFSTDTMTQLTKACTVVQKYPRH